MTWDRIEEEWTTMTRRIRADRRDNAAKVTAQPPLSGSPASTDPPEQGMDDVNVPTLR